MTDLLTKPSEPLDHVLDLNGSIDLPVKLCIGKVIFMILRYWRVQLQNKTTLGGVEWEILALEHLLIGVFGVFPAHSQPVVSVFQDKRMGNESEFSQGMRNPVIIENVMITRVFNPHDNSDDN